VFPYRKATRAGTIRQVPDCPGVVVEPGMHARALHGNREICGLAPGALGPGSAPGRRGAVAGDARPAEVRPLHRSQEVGEQPWTTGGGVDGAKGGGRGKHAQTSHAPDAVPGERVVGA
jgi:hypothetical protein